MVELFLRVRYERQGEHTHARFFSSQKKNRAAVLNGTLVFENEEFRAFKQMMIGRMNANIDFFDDTPKES